MGTTRHQGLPEAQEGQQRHGAITGRPLGGQAQPAAEPARLEEREVRAADPELSPETNAVLSEELREAVGADHVRVPADRPHASQGELPPKRSPRDYISQHRLQVIGSLAIALTFGAIIALTTGDWWFLPLAAGVHALATMTVVLTVVHMTTIIEHPSPDVAAALAEDGVSSPDERFSQMVEEFSQRPEHGAADVLSPGHNERTVPAGADPATASAEQSSAMTPTEDPSPSGGAGGTPDLILWAAALALFGLSLALPPTMGGGWMWLLTAVMVPLLVGWVMMQRLMMARSERVHLQGRRPMVAIVVCTGVAVAVFCAVVAIGFHH